MTLDTQDLKYWVGFSLIPGIGRARISLLQQVFPTLEAAWHASAEELSRSELDRRTLAAIQRSRVRIDLDAQMAKLAELHITPLVYLDPAYPELLGQIYDYPPVLYVRGDLLPEDKTSVAVVGTRKATAYGREATDYLVKGLSRNRVTVISGLARGIDTAAHKAALDAGGRTIAVLACGLDMVYPAENLGLAKEIMQHGALVSEHPPGAKPEASHFPRRNRIMSGLSLGVLVIEAGQDSGAHITARFALEQDRELFAVPGSIFSPGSKGPNRWIQEGAKLVFQPEDILEELNVAMIGQQIELKSILPASSLERRLLNHLSREPTHIDVVVRLSGLPITEVSSTLAMMELKGMVRQVGAMNYVAAH